jgi:SlyX protein
LGSNGGMAQPHPIDTHVEQRLTDLEIKLSFTEDLVDDLNQIIVRQQQQIDLLLRELGQIQQQQQDSGSTPFRSLRDELPPHY